VIKILNLERRLPSKKYLAGVAAHFTSIYAAITYTEWAALLTPITLLYCIQRAGQEQEYSWIEDFIDTKIELDKAKRELDEEGVDYEEPSLKDTLLKMIRNR